MNKYTYRKIGKYHVNEDTFNMMVKWLVDRNVIAVDPRDNDIVWIDASHIPKSKRDKLFTRL